MIRADLIAAASAAADAATRARDPRHATTTAHVVAAALPVIVGAVTDELRRLHFRHSDKHPDLARKINRPWYCCAAVQFGAIAEDDCQECHAPYPCPTRSLLGALDAEAGRNEGETNG